MPIQLRSPRPTHLSQSRVALLIVALAGLATLTAACTSAWSAPSQPAPVPSVTAATPNPTAMASDAAAATEEEEDCMAGCHTPSVNDLLDAGAADQPADHAGRVACLSCHSNLAQPSLPATHAGRMDPSCAVCHKPAQ